MGAIARIVVIEDATNFPEGPEVFGPLNTTEEADAFIDLARQSRRYAKGAVYHNTTLDSPASFYDA